MRHRTITTIDVDGIEVELDNNPEYFEPITVQPTPDTLVVGYLLQDYDCENPMTSCDCEGKLYTEPSRGWGGGSITDDSAAPAVLGLEEFGNSRGGPDYDLELDGIAERVADAVKAKIRADPELSVWMVANVMETGETMEKLVDDLVEDDLEGSQYTHFDWSSDEDQAMIARLYEDDAGGYLALARTAWEDLYAEGKIGEYLAVPVNYCSNNHGPGTASAHTTDLDSANAVWVPDKCSIENMSFPAGATYAEKLEVAAKYAAGVLENYTKWCNGECYWVVVETFKLEGGEYERIESDSCWGFIGYAYAEEELTRMMGFEANKFKEEVVV